MTSSKPDSKEELPRHKNTKKKKKKKKKPKWEMQQHIGSVRLKIKFKLDGNDEAQDILKEHGWFCNRRSQITNLKNGQKPTPENCPETHVIQQFIAHLLTDYYKYRRIIIEGNTEQQIMAAHIYVSPNYEQKRTLLLIIPGTGIVNAGEFSSSICKFDNVVDGSAFPFIEYAEVNDFGVILFDPNGIEKQHFNILDKIHCCHIFDHYILPHLKGNTIVIDEKLDSNSISKECKSNVNEINEIADDISNINIDGDHKSDNHSCANVENILILGHSAGGRRVTYLLLKRGNILRSYLRGIAFTDIQDPFLQLQRYKREGHSAEAKLIENIYGTCARNWVKTKNDDSLDTPMLMKKGKTAVIERVSCGHSDHKYTTAAAFPSVVAFFDEKVL